MGSHLWASVGLSGPLWPTRVPWHRGATACSHGQSQQGSLACTVAHPCRPPRSECGGQRAPLQEVEGHIRPHPQPSLAVALAQRWGCQSAGNSNLLASCMATSQAALSPLSSHPPYPTHMRWWPASCCTPCTAAPPAAPGSSSRTPCLWPTSSRAHLYSPRGTGHTGSGGRSRGIATSGSCA